MPKENEQDKQMEDLSKELLEFLEDDPFGLQEKIDLVNFRCRDCEKTDEVPDFVVHEFSLDKTENEEVTIECPYCGGTMTEEARPK